MFFGYGNLYGNVWVAVYILKFVLFLNSAFDNNLSLILSRVPEKKGETDIKFVL